MFAKDEIFEYQANWLMYTWSRYVETALYWDQNDMSYCARRDCYKYPLKDGRTNYKCQ